MKSIPLLVCVVSVLLISACRVEVGVYEDGTGQKLVEQAFQLMKDADVAALETFMGTDFNQSTAMAHAQKNRSSHL